MMSIGETLRSIAFFGSYPVEMPQRLCFFFGGETFNIPHDAPYAPARCSNDIKHKMGRFDQGSYTREKAVSFLTGFTRLTRFRESFGLVREVFL